MFTDARNVIDEGLFARCQLTAFWIDGSGQARVEEDTEPKGMDSLGEVCFYTSRQIPSVLFFFFLPPFPEELGWPGLSKVRKVTMVTTDDHIILSIQDRRPMIGW